MSRRRWPVIGGGIAAVAIVVFVVWRVRQGREPLPAAGAPRRSAPAAQAGDMAGMNMSADSTVQLTPNQLRQFGVTFGTAKERMLENTVRAVGTVAVDETKLTDVTPRFGGYVERLYVNTTGEQVRVGEPLMEVYSPELAAAEQELLVAENLQQSIGQSSIPGVPAAYTDLVDAARRRFALWGISESQIDDIVRNGKVRRTLTLHARTTGIVLEKHVIQGQAIQPGELLYRIANLDDVWISVSLREQDARDVGTGSHAVVTLVSSPGRTMEGRVAYVYPTLDEAARTVQARVQVPNQSRSLKPGMYATVVLTTPSRRALTVPTSAVLNTGTRSLAFRDMGGGHLMPVPIVTGRTAGAYTEVLSGLTAGQRVVTSAQYLLDSESNLAEVLKSMIAQGNGSDMNSTGTTQDVPGMNGTPAPPARPDSTPAGARSKDSAQRTPMPPPATTPRR